MPLPDRCLSLPDATGHCHEVSFKDRDAIGQRTTIDMLEVYGIIHATNSTDCELHTFGQFILNARNSIHNTQIQGFVSINLLKAKGRNSINGFTIINKVELTAVETYITKITEQDT